MKKLFSILALILVFCMPAYAMAATEPNTKTIEETTSYESDTIRITIDRWCYAFNRTSLRFFVANVYVNDPAQLHTAFAGEQYFCREQGLPSKMSSILFAPAGANSARRLAALRSPSVPFPSWRTSRRSS